MEIREDQICFLVATDVHLGHKEQDPIRKDDSYEGLEEVFEKAKKHQVDFLLLGGDLFDQVNPSKECYLRCLKIFNENVFGKKDLKLETTLNGQTYKTNFTRSNVSISLPVFTIHGNHDYPNNDFGKVSVCDLLDQSNFVNYFGKQLSLHSILIRPLIISKKNCRTKIALYGLGYIKDPILNDLFQQKKAIFEKPFGDLNEYFTVFITHQNRYKKNFKTGVPLSLSFVPQNIPQWMNLTIWCHQHEAIYNTQVENDRIIYQPGSTVITSLIEAESIKKQCVLVKVNLKKFTAEPILLERSFRPMFCFNFEARKVKEEFNNDYSLFKYLDQKISNTLQQSIKSNPNKKPIIRIKIQYLSSQEMLRFQELQSKYQNFVANPLKIFLFKRQKKVEKIQPPSDFDEVESLQLIKNKKHTVQPSFVVPQFVSNLKQNLTAQKLHFFPPSFFLELSKSVSPDMSQTTSIFGKQLERISSQISQYKQNNIHEKDQKLLNDYKTSLKYQHQKLRKDLNLSNEYAKQQNTSFRSQKDQAKMMTSNTFLERCKQLEDQITINTSDLFGNLNINQIQINKKPSPQRISKLKQQKQKDSFDFDRSESQDCCERASKQQINQERNIARFEQAHHHITETNSRKRKKDDVIKPKANPKKEKNEFNQGKKGKYNKDFM